MGSDCISSWSLLIFLLFKEISLKVSTNGKSDKAFLLTTKFSPLGSVCSCAGPTCIKKKKKKKKLNLQQMNEVTRHFCWHQIFVPWGLSASAHEMLLYKIRLQRDCLKLATNDRSDKMFLLTSKFSPQGVVSPCPGAIYMYKIMKNLYKIRLQRVFFFKLEANDRSDKVFLLTSKLCPLGLSAPDLRLYIFIKSWKAVYKLRGWSDSF